jgi:hypothetical protein
LPPAKPRSSPLTTTRSLVSWLHARTREASLGQSCAPFDADNLQPLWLVAEIDQGNEVEMTKAVTIYGIKNCDTMKKARAWLDQRGVAYG